MQTTLAVIATAALILVVLAIVFHSSVAYSRWVEGESYCSSTQRPQLSRVPSWRRGSAQPHSPLCAAVRDGTAYYVQEINRVQTVLLVGTFCGTVLIVLGAYALLMFITRKLEGKVIRILTTSGKTIATWS